MIISDDETLDYMCDNFGSFYSDEMVFGGKSRDDIEDKLNNELDKMNHCNDLVAAKSIVENCNVEIGTDMVNDLHKDENLTSDERTLLIARCEIYLRINLSLDDMLETRHGKS